MIYPYIKNCPDTRPAVIIILGPNPANSPRKPASLARTASRCGIDPVGPCPLLIWLSSVSAGWLRIAAAKPAMTPEPSAMVNFVVAPMSRFVSSLIDRSASSWQNSFTVNCPIAYGICLHRIGRKPA